MPCEPDCVGTHVAAARENHQVIDWDVPHHQAYWVRVKGNTCDFEPVFYELCMGGGLLFIRRTTQGEERVAVHESPWRNSAVTLEVWERLLRGEAR